MIKNIFCYLFTHKQYFLTIVIVRNSLYNVMSVCITYLNEQIYLNIIFKKYFVMRFSPNY